MLKPLIVAAIKSEFLPDSLGDHQVHYTGIGKINATYVTTKLIHEFRPNLIINIGTVGALKQEYLGKLHKIKTVVEHDVKCEPLSPRGTVPFDLMPNKIEIHENGLHLATGDSFITSPDEWLIKNGIDLVDMECFAIAKVALMENVQFFSLKFASDLADSNADKDWKNHIVNNPMNLNYEITQFLGELNV